jgi:hypothetical protein
MVESALVLVSQAGGPRAIAGIDAGNLSPAKKFNAKQRFINPPPVCYARNQLCVEKGAECQVQLTHRFRWAFM